MNGEGIPEHVRVRPLPQFGVFEYPAQGSPPVIYDCFPVPVPAPEKVSRI
jgi:hypothetical protein